MQRRKFLKGLAAGTAPTAAVPFTAPAANSATACSQTQRDENGLQVERFAHDSRVRSGMALGGIGAGSISLRKDGRFTSSRLKFVEIMSEKPL